MTIDIGSETTGVIIAPGTEKKGYATKRECTKTGKLHIIGFETEAASKTTKIIVGIRKEAAGAVGEFMAESAETTIEELKAKKWEIPLTSDVEIVSGTSYFLCIIPTVGTFKMKATEKAGWGFKTTLGVTKVSEGTWTTAENKWGEPAPVWGVEAAGGTGLLATSTNITTIGGTESIGAKAAVSTSASAVKIAGTETIGAKAGLSTSTSAVKVGGSQKLAALAAIVTTTKVVIGGLASIVGTGGTAVIRKTLAFIFDDEDD